MMLILALKTFFYNNKTLQSLENGNEKLYVYNQRCALDFLTTGSSCSYLHPNLNKFRS